MPTSSKARPEGRRFWVTADVAAWIEKNATTPSEADVVEQAVWWCVYREAQSLVDDTIRHVAQAIQDGIGPYDRRDVDLKLQNWSDHQGYEGHSANTIQVDDDIEEDLKLFFINGR